MHERIMSQFRWGMYERMLNWQGKMVRCKKRECSGQTVKNKTKAEKNSLGKGWAKSEK